MFVLYKTKISGERLQDHWSSGFTFFLFINYYLCWKSRRENSHSFVYILIDTLLGRILIFVTTTC